VRYGVKLPENYRHMPDVFVTMAAAAAVTTRLKFGMDVCLVTQLNPLILAEESAIMGVPFKQRVRPPRS
jgi:alkanesulfonate monooxygenase SsuD/methylene tetrahydromethanopterin reductase-like flavin-dependent oxidoreductase (luciferase family)